DPRSTGPASARRDVDEAVTVPTPVVQPDGPGGPSDETTVLSRVRDEDAGQRSGDSRVSDAEVTTELPKPPVPPGAADETAVLPPVPPGAADETAVLPPVRGDEQGPADRVPPGYFRDERPAGGYDGHHAPEGPEDRTRELPQVDPEATPRRRRQRPDWAEETPLDDLPSLADELLGPRDDEYGDEGGGRGRG
ncbi:dTMP kinase, partial [Streptomyces sp. SID7804]|nr:dTMP kinase [Streptomyces sp. SID7804]